MATTDKTQLLNRARSIQGHMGAIVRMLEEDAYCVDIIKQTQAIEKAIDKLNALILEKHMCTSPQKLDSKLTFLIEDLNTCSVVARATPAHILPA